MGMSDPALDHVFVAKMVTTEGVELPPEIFYTGQGVLARIEGDKSLARVDCWYIPELGADPVHKFSMIDDVMTVDEEAAD